MEYILNKIEEKISENQEMHFNIQNGCINFLKCNVKIAQVYFELDNPDIIIDHKYLSLNNHMKIIKNNDIYEIDTGSIVIFLTISEFERLQEIVKEYKSH